MPKFAAAAVDRPEQLGLLGRADRDEAAEAVDQGGAENAVGGDPVRPPEPAHAPGEGHADDGDVRVAATQKRQTGAFEGNQQLAGLDPRADARAAARRVDLDGAQRPGAEQQHLVEGVAGAVASWLRGDLGAVLDGPADRGLDVVDVGDLEDGDGRLIDGQRQGTEPGPTRDARV